MDPADFYDLPEEWQMLHIAHTRNLFIGRYEPDPDGLPGRGPPSISAPDPGYIERWRTAGPTDHDIEQARSMLKRPGLPDSIRRLAASTLKQAEHPGAQA